MPNNRAMTDKTTESVTPGRYKVKAPSRGGARPNSGRPKGAVRYRKTRELANDALNSGKISPIEVILEAMHAARKKKDLAGAAAFAKDAAPYIHSRLQAV